MRANESALTKLWRARAKRRRSFFFADVFFRAIIFAMIVTISGSRLKAYRQIWRRPSSSTLASQSGLQTAKRQKMRALPLKARHRPLDRSSCSLAYTRPHPHRPLRSRVANRHNCRKTCVSIFFVAGCRGDQRQRCRVGRSTSTRPRARALALVVRELIVVAALVVVVVVAVGSIDLAHRLAAGCDACRVECTFSRCLSSLKVAKTARKIVCDDDDN